MQIVLVSVFLFVFISSIIIKYCLVRPLWSSCLFTLKQTGRHNFDTMKYYSQVVPIYQTITHTHTQNNQKSKPNKWNDVTTEWNTQTLGWQFIKIFSVFFFIFFFLFFFFFFIYNSHFYTSISTLVPLC